MKKSFAWIFSVFFILCPVKNYAGDLSDEKKEELISQGIDPEKWVLFKQILLEIRKFESNTQKEGAYFQMFSDTDYNYFYHYQGTGYILRFFSVLLQYVLFGKDVSKGLFSKKCRSK